jgi:hypothetical protein
MLRAVIANDELTFESSVRGIAIYLDMFAVKLLAKGDSSLRQRFVAAINHGAICFSRLLTRLNSPGLRAHLLKSSSRS